MCPTVQHIEERDGKHASRRPTEVLEQRNSEGCRRRTRGRQRNGQDGVGTQPGFVRSPVQIQHDLVEGFLVYGVAAQQRRSDLVVNIGNGPRYALAAVAVSTISKLNRFERPRRCSRRNRCSTEGAASEEHLGLDGRVPPGIEDFTGPDHIDSGHGPSLCGNVSHDYSCSPGNRCDRPWRLPTMCSIHQDSYRPVHRSSPSAGTGDRTDRPPAAAPLPGRYANGGPG